MTRPAILLAALLAPVACRERGETDERAQPAPAVSPSVAAPAASAVCDSVVLQWRAAAGVEVRAADTVASVPTGAAAESGCFVSALAPQGLDSLRWNSRYWATEGARGWTELLSYTADGPDGGTRTLERSGVRCRVDVAQDGDDDSDPSYVPRPAVEERTFCWAATHPG